MPTHIDVLVGDYDSCVRYNYLAIMADEKLIRISPDTAGTESFYFGYIGELWIWLCLICAVQAGSCHFTHLSLTLLYAIVHNFHMLVYGAILGGMESIAMDTAHRLISYLNENLFVQNPDLTAYLESYSSLGEFI